MQQATIAENTKVIEEKSFALSALQKEYDQVEDELLETLDRLDELQEKASEGSTNVAQLHILQHELEKLQFELSSQSQSSNAKDKTIADLEEKCKALDDRLVKTSELSRLWRKNEPKHFPS